MTRVVRLWSRARILLTSSVSATAVAVQGEQGIARIESGLRGGAARVHDRDAQTASRAGAHGHPEIRAESACRKSAGDPGPRR